MVETAIKGSMFVSSIEGDVEDQAIEKGCD
jgi:hypothetical protein